VAKAGAEEPQSGVVRGKEIAIAFGRGERVAGSQKLPYFLRPVATLTVPRVNFGADGGPCGLA